jgi:hypothetical protein
MTKKINKKKKENKFQRIQMNIEFKFLQKAIQDKNYISFSYEDEYHKDIKPLELDINNKLYTERGTFEYKKISKLQILKDKF